MARSSLQLPVQAIVASRNVVTITPRNATPVCTPTDAGTSWRRTVCPWAPRRLGPSSENVGMAPTPTGTSTPMGLNMPTSFWPLPSGEQSSTPSSKGSVCTPHNGTSTLHRMSSCWAPERKPTSNLSADSVSPTPMSSHAGLATPVNFWPGTPGGAHGTHGGGSRSVPLQGPLARLMCSDPTPVASMRSKVSPDASHQNIHSTPRHSFARKSYSGFEGLTPLSMDVTPIHIESSPSHADWLSSYLADVETPNASLNHARFLDSQPSTPMSWPVSPPVAANAFGMPTVQEGDHAMSPEDARQASSQPASSFAGMEKPEQEEGYWMPPPESLMGGA